MKPLVIFGLRQIGEVAAFYFREDTPREVAAFCVHGDQLQEDSFAGAPVVAFEDLETTFPPDTHDLFVALGYANVNADRRLACEMARAKGYTLPSYVSPRATTVSDLSHGDNCFILEDNTIQPFARIGQGVTLWSGNHIGHHAVIGDYAFISSHVVVSGGVEVGAQTFMGVNSTTNNHITIGERCVVGSGALVTKNLADEAVVSAQPGKQAKAPSSRLRKI